jgi:uncharacterized protein YhfF
LTDSAIDAYWRSYLETLPPDSPGRDGGYEAEAFGDGPELAEELGALILAGTKTATCSALWEWEAGGEPVTEVGLKTVVLGGDGRPLCIIETTEVEIRRFDEVDEDFAREEGEGDLSLEYWRRAHERFFSRNLPKIGRVFSEGMPLVCERFRVIHR